LTLNCLSSSIYERPKDSLLRLMPVWRNMRPIKGRGGSGDFVNVQAQTFCWSVWRTIALSCLCYSICSLSVCCIHNPLLCRVLKTQALPPRERGFVTLYKSPSLLLSVGSDYTVSTPSALSRTKPVGSSGCWDGRSMN